MRARAASSIATIAIAAMAIAARPGAQVGPPAPATAPSAQAASSAPPPPATGTGLIMGRVLDGSSNKPIRGAAVILTVQVTPSAPGVPGGPAIPNFRPQAVVTGSDGVFVFSGLPPGTFFLVSSASGPTQMGPDGQQSNQLITLADGEKNNDIEVRFLFAGAVTGRVRDERGDGVEGITISLLRSTINGGRRTVTVVKSALTDDRGVYRIANVSAGDYGVCALFSRHIAPVAAGVAQAAGNTDMRQTLSGSGAQSPTGSGYRVGDLLLISSSSSRNVDPAPGEDGRLSVFADACYPAAPNISEMDTVHVESGQERAQVDMVVRIVPSIRITGTVVGPSNRLSGLGVHLYPALPGDLTLMSPIEAAQTVTDPDGGFGFVGVPAGSYVVRAVYTAERSLPPEFFFLNAGSPQAEMMLASQPGSPPSEPTLWAAASITAGDSDINGLTLTLREGPHITGVVAFDGSKERPQAARITASTVAFESADVAAFYSIARGRMTADGTFATAGLVPGRYFIRPAFSFPGWSVKSITANGRDALDDPIEVAATDLSGITITLTDRPIELSGTVRASGQPDRRARVVVFPSDRARWSVPTSGRRMVMTTVSRQGTFSFAGLPAGDYLVATMSDQADSNWQNPKVLEALAHDATLVSLRDGDHRTVDLTRNPGR